LDGRQADNLESGSLSSDEAFSDDPVPEGLRSSTVDPAALAGLYVQHAEELRRFLTGVLRDPDLAGEVLQVAFAKAVDLGHLVQDGSLKAWLFRVAYNEALAMRRRKAVHERATRELLGRGSVGDDAPESGLIRFETVERVRAALESLPAEQREVVRRRIYEGQKFATIANQTGLPLGTVLTRMKLALNKLRERLRSEND
jgi:RNA polymerase sigma-70 factor (ECF subfamily)